VTYGSSEKRKVWPQSPQFVPHDLTPQPFAERAKRPNTSFCGSEPNGLQSQTANPLKHEWLAVHPKNEGVAPFPGRSPRPTHRSLSRAAEGAS
jgi:hypothetical protein